MKEVMTVKRLFCVKLFLSLVLIFVFAGGAAALETFNLNFTLYNESGYSFKRVFVRPSHLNEKWSRVNIRPLRSGYHIKIDTSNCGVLARKNYLRYWDIRVYYGDTWHQWEGIRLSAITQFWVDSDFYATWD